MSVALDTCRKCFNYKQHDNEALSDCTIYFKVCREILQLHLGGPILVAKAIEGSHLVHLQIENNEEGGLDLLLGLDQETIIDYELSTCVHLENADQRKCGSVLKGLQSQKNMENPISKGYNRRSWSVK